MIRQLGVKIGRMGYDRKDSFGCYETQDFIMGVLSVSFGRAASSWYIEPECAERADVKTNCKFKDITVGSIWAFFIILKIILLHIIITYISFLHSFLSKSGQSKIAHKE